MRSACLSILRQTSVWIFNLLLCQRNCNKRGGNIDSSTNSSQWIISEPLTFADCGTLHICLEYRSVVVCKKEIILTTKEFDILALLMMNAKRVLTYEMISDLVWKSSYDVCSRNTITSHICTLRKKLGSDYSETIKCVHHIGYKFDGEVEIYKQNL